MHNIGALATENAREAGKQEARLSTSQCDVARNNTAGGGCATRACRILRLRSILRSIRGNSANNVLELPGIQTGGQALQGQFRASGSHAVQDVENASADHRATTSATFAAPC